MSVAGTNLIQKWYNGHMKICTMCQESKPEEEFHFKNKATGRRNPRCKSCQSTLMKKHYQDNLEKYAERNKKTSTEQRERHRRYLFEYLKTHPCVDCGEEDVEVLQFDHIEMLNGDRHRPTNSSWLSIPRLQAEIDKCEIRCANCHVRRTRRQMGWMKPDTEPGLQTEKQLPH